MHRQCVAPRAITAASTGNLPSLRLLLTMIEIKRAIIALLWFLFLGLETNPPPFPPAHDSLHMYMQRQSEEPGEISMMPNALLVLPTTKYLA